MTAKNALVGLLMTAVGCFWEGPQWDAFGFFVQYLWAFGIVFGVFFFCFPSFLLVHVVLLLDFLVSKFVFIYVFHNFD